MSPKTNHLVLTVNQCPLLHFFLGNSYRDATQFASSISKPAVEAIAMPVSTRQQILVHDQHGSNAGLHHLARNQSELGRMNLNESASGSNYQRQSQINIDTEAGNKIFLNIYPSRNGSNANNSANVNTNLSQYDTGPTTTGVLDEIKPANIDVIMSKPNSISNKKPAVNINIDVVSENNDRHWCINDSNISVVYNRDGNIRIAIAHDDTKLKMKRIKRGGVHKHRLFQFFISKRTKKFQDLRENWISPSQAPMASTDESLINTGDALRGINYDCNQSCVGTSKIDSSCLHPLFRDEDELDAYMKELRSRKCL